jgi:uncharacterized membrane protein
LGSRSGGRARGQANLDQEADLQGRPLSVTLAAAVEAIQAAGVLAAAAYAGAAAGQGKSYQSSSGIALTVIAAGTAVVLALVALGLFRVRRWSRTPALLTQIFTGIVGIYLVQGHQYWLGGLAIALAVAGLALLLVPPSLRALTFPAKASRS